MAPTSRASTANHVANNSGGQFDSLQSWLNLYGNAEYVHYKRGAATPHLSYEDWAASQHALGPYLYHLTLDAWAEDSSSDEDSDGPALHHPPKSLAMNGNGKLHSADSTKVAHAKPTVPVTATKRRKKYEKVPKLLLPEDTARSTPASKVASPNTDYATPDGADSNSNIRRGLRTRTAAQQRPYFHNAKILDEHARPTSRDSNQSFKAGVDLDNDDASGTDEGRRRSHNEDFAESNGTRGAEERKPVQRISFKKPAWTTSATPQTEGCKSSVSNTSSTVVDQQAATAGQPTPTTRRKRSSKASLAGSKGDAAEIDEAEQRRIYDPTGQGNAGISPPKKRGRPRKNTLNSPSTLKTNLPVAGNGTLERPQNAGQQVNEDVGTPRSTGRPRKPSQISPSVVMSELAANDDYSDEDYDPTGRKKYLAKKAAATGKKRKGGRPGKKRLSAALIEDLQDDMDTVDEEHVEEEASEMIATTDFAEKADSKEKAKRKRRASKKPISAEVVESDDDASVPEGTEGLKPLSTAPVEEKKQRRRPRAKKLLSAETIDTADDASVGNEPEDDHQNVLLSPDQAEKRSRRVRRPKKMLSAETIDSADDLTMEDEPEEEEHSELISETPRGTEKVKRRRASKKRLSEAIIKAEDDLTMEDEEEAVFDEPTEVADDTAKAKDKQKRRKRAPKKRLSEAVIRSEDDLTAEDGGDGGIGGAIGRIDGDGGDVEVGDDRVARRESVAVSPHDKTAPTPPGIGSFDRTPRRPPTPDSVLGGDDDEEDDLPEPEGPLSPLQSARKRKSDT